jgi:hypothetical protein
LRWRYGPGNTFDNGFRRGQLFSGGGINERWGFGRGFEGAELVLENLVEGALALDNLILRVDLTALRMIAGQNLELHLGNSLVRKSPPGTAGVFGAPGGAGA